MPVVWGGVHPSILPQQTLAEECVDINWARQVLSGIVAQNLNIAFTRMHICFDSLEKLTDEDFSLLEKAGCRCLGLGIESGSARIRHLLHKEIDENRLLELNRRPSRYSFLLQTREMIKLRRELKKKNTVYEGVRLPAL